MFDKKNKNQSKISNYKNIKKYKTSKSDISKTLRENMQDTISQEIRFYHLRLQRKDL